MTTPPLSCRSPVGIAVGLVDSAIGAIRALAEEHRDLSPQPVQEALADLFQDPDLRKVRDAWQEAAPQAGAPTLRQRVADRQQFVISTRASGTLRTVRVIVYDDLNALRDAAQKFTDQEPGYFADAFGVAQSYQPWLADPPSTDGPSAGIIRFWRGGLGTSVVVHEVTHMACAIYRRDHRTEHGSVDDSMDSEEILAYLVGNLSRSIVNQLYKRGYYEEAT